MPQRFHNQVLKHGIVKERVTDAHFGAELAVCRRGEHLPATTAVVSRAKARTTKKDSLAQKRQHRRHARLGALQRPLRRLISTEQLHHSVFKISTAA
jgi:hypothetical protein